MTFVCYTLLFRIAARHQKQIAALEIVLSEEEKVARKDIKRNVKAAKTMGIVIGAFALCWLPYTFVFLYGIVTGDKSPNLKKIATYLGWIALLNSGINPIIYATKISTFRLAFWRLLRCSKIRPAQNISSSVFTTQ